MSRLDTLQSEGPIDHSPAPSLLGLLPLLSGSPGDVGSKALSEEERCQDLGPLLGSGGKWDQDWPRAVPLHTRDHGSLQGVRRWEAGWDNPRLGHSPNSGGAKSQPAHRRGRAPGQCWAWDLSRGHGQKAPGLGVVKQTGMAMGGPQLCAWGGEAGGRCLDLKHDCFLWLWLLPTEPLLEVPPCPPLSLAWARIS